VYTITIPTSSRNIILNIWDTGSVPEFEIREQ
jgi:hypothetical protein